MDCAFNNAVNVDDLVVFLQKDLGDGLFSIEASVNGLLCARLRLAASKPAPPPDGQALQLDAPVESSAFNRVTTPLDEPPTFHLKRHYSIPIDPTDLAKVLPKVAHYLDPSRAAGFLALSYFVGMICPGLDSIFASVSIKLADVNHLGQSVAFDVHQYDERFGLFRISVQGILSGHITAFRRPPPQQQLTMDAVATTVERDEFKGSRSLVIGASRGLGEMVAKILAAGGGDVTIAYAHGRDDIENVHKDITASSLGSSRIAQLDVTSPAAFDSLDFESLDSVYFFATPRIYRKKADVFDRALFQEFCDFYIDALYRLCVHIEHLPRTRKISIYVPSSVFVSERPEGLAEYAMAKSAAEVMIEDINRSFGKVSVLATRLPRLSTDQTTSVLKVSTGDNLSALIPVVRAMVHR
jgi:hypothetical protein